MAVKRGAVPRWEDERAPVLPPLVAATLITSSLGFALFHAVDAALPPHRLPAALAVARVMTLPPVIPPAPPLPRPELRAPPPPPPPSLPRLELVPPPVRVAARALPTLATFRPVRTGPSGRVDTAAVAPTADAAVGPVAPAPPVDPPPGDPRARDTLEGRIRAAVQSALRYPESAHDMGVQGRVLVGFDYRDRDVSDIRLLTSSGNALLDGAALRTVHDATYPAPGRLAGRTLALAVWVEFRISGDG